MKEYVVYFYVKANRTEYLCDVVVEAKTAVEACKLVKHWYHKKTGKNAFRPTTKKPTDTWYAERGSIRHFDRVTCEL